MTEIRVDGVLYVPAREVLINASDVLRVLVEEYMGETPQGEIEKLSSELWVVIVECPGAYCDPPTIKELVERMAL